MGLPSLANKENMDTNELPIRQGISPEKEMYPSEHAIKMETLMPCGTCGRSFNQKALELLHYYEKDCFKESNKRNQKPSSVHGI